MSTLVGEVYQAFRSACVDHDRAMKAATALIWEDLDVPLVKRKLRLIMWMTGSTLALSAAILLKLFVH